jgi:hypothetical protein
MITKVAAAVAAAAFAAANLSHVSAVSQITQAGLTWSSSGNCDDRHNPNCTSLEGIRQTTIDGIITLKQASGCPVNVTGGTETGHGSGGLYTHWDGWKIDISKSSCVDGYIKNNFRYLGYVSGWGYQYRSPAGNLYVDESDHWDILYYNCGGCEPEPATPPAPVTEPAPPVSPSPATSPSPPAGPGQGTAPGQGGTPLPSASPSSTGPRPSGSAGPGDAPTPVPQQGHGSGQTAGKRGDGRPEPDRAVRHGLPAKG